jgi:hypothetical protein
LCEGKTSIPIWDNGSIVWKIQASYDLTKIIAQWMKGHHKRVLEEEATLVLSMGHIVNCVADNTAVQVYGLKKYTYHFETAEFHI